MSIRRVVLSSVLLGPLLLIAGAYADDEPADPAENESTADAEDTAAPAELEAAVPTENEGLADLDQATQLKVTAEGLADLNDVIDRLDSALDKGLDDDNRRFAEELLISSLLERATALSGAVFNRPLQDPRVDPRWIQVRQFALTDLQRALELDDELWEAHMLVGRLQAMPLGDPNAARRALTKVTDAADAADEQRALALAVRGALPGNKDREADFRRAVELQPEKPDYFRIRAQYYYGEDKFAEALADIDKALELEPDHASSQEVRGLILLGLDRLDEALATFNRAGELAPEAVLPYQHRGEVYRRQGDFKKAAEQLTKALELAPGDVGTLILRASVYHYQLDDSERALKDVEEVIRLQPQLLVAHLLRAEIFAATERVDQAIGQLEQLLPLAPDQPRLLEPLATYYLIGGRTRKSIEVFSKLLELDPENYRGLRFRGDAYLNIGQHAEAIADFDRAVELNDEDDGLLNNFAWVLSTSPDDEVRDGERAIKLATKAAELSSYNTPHILSTLAAAYAETDDFESAKKWSEKALEVSQSAIDLEKDSQKREKLETDHKNLQEELSSYEAGKPVRERQSQEEAPPQPAAKPAEDAQTSTPPSKTPAPADSLEF